METLDKIYDMEWQKRFEEIILNRVIEITGELGHQACNIALYLAAKMRADPTFLRFLSVCQSVHCTAAQWYSKSLCLSGLT